MDYNSRADLEGSMRRSEALAARDIITLMLDTRELMRARLSDFYANFGQEL